MCCVSFDVVVLRFRLYFDGGCWFNLGMMEVVVVVCGIVYVEVDMG